MGRYQEQVARRNGRYEYDIPDGALHCDVVSGTEPILDDEGRTVGVRTWRGVRYLLRLDPSVRGSIEVLEDVIAEQAKALGESLMRARLALTALDVGDLAGAVGCEPDEARAILSELCRYLVDAGAVDPMEVER